MANKHFSNAETIVFIPENKLLVKLIIYFMYLMIDWFMAQSACLLQKFPDHIDKMGDTPEQS